MNADRAGVSARDEPLRTMITDSKGPGDDDTPTTGHSLALGQLANFDGAASLENRVTGYETARMVEIIGAH